MTQLNAIQAGQKGRIVSIEGDNRFIGRITSIGLTIGCSVEMICNERKRPVLLFSRDTMIALGSRECEHISLEVEG
ncbi:MAG: ferrous iron transport protein A [Oscillospiraceae bacterium]|nr:ferrous iron transport protein A [Oscillospiraceae bacterium]